jgi:hypothetical protein
MVHKTVCIYNKKFERGRESIGIVKERRDFMYVMSYLQISHHLEKGEKRIKSLDMMPMI